MNFVFTRTTSKIVMRIVMLLAFIVLTPFSPAQAAPFVAFGSQMVFETSANGRTVEARKPFSVRGGYRFDDSDLYLEYTSYRLSEGESYVAVRLEHQEFLGWIRHVAEPSWPLSPYMAAGIGAGNDHVETVFGAEEVRDAGAPQVITAVAAGCLANLTRMVDLQLESRLAIHSGSSTSPVLGLAASLGWKF